MNRKEAETKVRQWMDNIGTDDLRDYDCSGAQPEDCTMAELLEVIADAEEDEAIEQYENELWLQSLEEQEYDEDYGDYLNEHGN